MTINMHEIYRKFHKDIPYEIYIALPRNGFQPCKSRTH